MGVLKEALGAINKGLDIGKEVATDKDKLNDLMYTLETARAQLLLGGSGQSVTKITICGLVSLVVGTGTWMFLTGGNMALFKDYALAVTPLIGLLIGAYGSGAAFKHSKWSK